MNRTLVICLLVFLICFGASARDRNQGNAPDSTQRKRGLDMSAPFIEKGTFFIGGNLGWSSHVENDIDFSIVSNYAGEGYRLHVSPVFGYVFRDNMALGIRAKYSRALFKIDEANVNSGQVKTDVKDYYYLAHKGSAEFFVRPYIPFSKRFAIYADVCAGVRLSQAKNTQLKDGQTSGTWQKGFAIYGGVYPGLTAYLTSFMSIQVQVGLLTVDFANTNQIHNQTSDGENHFKKGNLMVDLTAISAGLTFDIGR